MEAGLQLPKYPTDTLPLQITEGAPAGEYTLVRTRSGADDLSIHSRLFCLTQLAFRRSSTFLRRPGLSRQDGRQRRYWGEGPLRGAMQRP